MGSGRVGSPLVPPYYLLLSTILKQTIQRRVNPWGDLSNDFLRMKEMIA